MNLSDFALIQADTIIYNPINASTKIKKYTRTTFEEFYESLTSDLLKKYPIFDDINKEIYSLLSKIIKENNLTSDSYYYFGSGEEDHQLTLIIIDIQKAITAYTLNLFKDNHSKFYFSMPSKKDMQIIIDFYDEEAFEVLEEKNFDYQNNYFEIFTFCENVWLKPLSLEALLIDKNLPEKEIRPIPSMEKQSPTMPPTESLLLKTIEIHPGFLRIDPELAAQKLFGKPKGTFIIHNCSKIKHLGLSYVREGNSLTLNHKIVGYLDFLIANEKIFYRGKRYDSLSEKLSLTKKKYETHPKILKQINDYETALSSLPKEINKKPKQGILDRLENEKMITDFLITEEQPQNINLVQINHDSNDFNKHEDKKAKIDLKPEL